MDFVSALSSRHSDRFRVFSLQSYNQLVVTWYTAVRLWFWLRLFLPRNQEGYTFVSRTARRGVPVTKRVS